MAGAAIPGSSLPAPLHRVLLTAAHFLRTCYWRIAQPRLYGCNVVVRNQRGEVLLIRHGYRDRAKWMLPGGGLKRREKPEDAGRREVLEETGCSVPDPWLVRVEHSRDSGARLRIHVLYGETNDEPIFDGREILEARFFPLDDLPEAITRVARRRIEIALTAAGDPAAQKSVS